MLEDVQKILALNNCLITIEPTENGCVLHIPERKVLPCQEMLVEYTAVDCSINVSVHVKDSVLHNVIIAPSDSCLRLIIFGCIEYLCGFVGYNPILLSNELEYSDAIMDKINVSMSVEDKLREKLLIEVCQKASNYGSTLEELKDLAKSYHIEDDFEFLKSCDFSSTTDVFVL